jgi:hypothetical protein
VLRRTTPPPHETMRAGPIVADVATRRVTVDGVPVALAGKEYELLLKLMTDPTRVFTKDAFAQREVWARRTFRVPAGTLPDARLARVTAAAPRAARRWCEGLRCQPWGLRAQRRLAAKPFDRLARVLVSPAWGGKSPTSRGSVRCAAARSGSCWTASRP